MFKKFNLCLFVLSVFVPFQLCWGENFDLRYTRWGMSQEQVIKAEEKLDPVEITENTIQYKTRIMGNNVELLYVFGDNRLIGAIYRVADIYLNSDHFTNTYAKFKKALIRKYGQPTEESTDWINNTYKYNRKKWGLALSLGHVEYASSWSTQTTSIDCSLREENHYVLCLIKYWSTEYSDLQKEILKEDEPIAIKPVDKMDPL